MKKPRVLVEYGTVPEEKRPYQFHNIYDEIGRQFRLSPEFKTIVKPAGVRVTFEHDQYWISVEDMHYQVEEPESSRFFSVALGDKPSQMYFEEV